MSVTAQDVFTIAMNLMDEETQDGAFTGYPDDYKKKSWPILSMLQAELLPATITPLAITSETTVLQIDDRSATTILPYGLAAHLMINDDQSKASFFNARYDELKRKRPARSTVIKDVYGVSTREPSSNATLSDGLDGGSFLDVNSGVWDGGEF